MPARWFEHVDEQFVSHARRCVGSLLAALLTVGAAACSSDSPSSSSTTAGTAAGTAAGTTAAGDDAANRATVVSFTIEQGEILGYALDADCVTKVVAQLTAADAALLAAGTLDTAPDATTPILSAAGDALGTKIDDCAVGSTDTALVAKAVDTVMSSAGGSGLDRVCVEAAFARLSDVQLDLVVNAAATSSTDPRLAPIGAELAKCLLTPAATSP
jgi:hypothetical protein